MTTCFQDPEFYRLLFRELRRRPATAGMPAHLGEGFFVHAMLASRCGDLDAVERRIDDLIQFVNENEAAFAKVAVN